MMMTNFFFLPVVDHRLLLQGGHVGSFLKSIHSLREHDQCFLPIRGGILLFTTSRQIIAKLVQSSANSISTLNKNDFPLSGRSSDYLSKR